MFHNIETFDSWIMNYIVSANIIIFNGPLHMTKIYCDYGLKDPRAPVDKSRVLIPSVTGQYTRNTKNGCKAT